MNKERLRLVSRVVWAAAIDWGGITCDAQGKLNGHGMDLIRQRPWLQNITDEEIRQVVGMTLQQISEALS